MRGAVDALAAGTGQGPVARCLWSRACQPPPFSHNPSRCPAEARQGIPLPGLRACWRARNGVGRAGLAASAPITAHAKCDSGTSLGSRDQSRPVPVLQLGVAWQLGVARRRMLLTVCSTTTLFHCAAHAGQALALVTGRQMPSLTGALACAAHAAWQPSQEQALLGSRLAVQGQAGVTAHKNLRVLPAPGGRDDAAVVE